MRVIGVDFPVRTKTFWNLINSNRNQIKVTIFRFIWIQTDAIRLDPNQSKNGNYNLILV